MKPATGVPIHSAQLKSMYNKQLMVIWAGISSKRQIALIGANGFHTQIDSMDRLRR
jgi:hypothetical protein